MASKPTIQYAVQDGKNLRTGEALKVPRTVNQPILSQDDIVDRAIDTYRVKVKRTEVVATMRGIFEQIILELRGGSASAGASIQSSRARRSAASALPLSWARR